MERSKVEIKWKVLDLRNGSKTSFPPVCWRTVGQWHSPRQDEWLETLWSRISSMKPAGNQTSVAPLSGSVHTSLPDPDHSTDKWPQTQTVNENSSVSVVCWCSRQSCGTWMRTRSPRILNTSPVLTHWHLFIYFFK